MSRILCSKCGTFACKSGDLEKVPENCPMIDETNQRFYELAKKLYLEDRTIRKISLNAAAVEASGYMRWTRVEETMEFARRCGFRKIGLAFCVGLRNEARILTEILNRNGFEVISVACKTGGIPKEDIGLAKCDKIRPDEFEAICNPIVQALLLNEEGTELNIILGLCVGHDTLFIMYSKAPVTCLAVKDRVLAHNPLGAIYTAHSYYRDKLIKR
uniref:DUF1847 domain-containing protein n=1 Tax=Geoglobus ahangari TaxID=113653 RepID=A0A7C4WEJ6_9EURY